MEIDTGAAVSLVSEETVNSSFMKDPTDVRLHTYTGEAVQGKSDDESYWRWDKSDPATAGSQVKWHSTLEQRLAPKTETWLENYFQFMFFTKLTASPEFLQISVYQRVRHFQQT